MLKEIDLKRVFFIIKIIASNINKSLSVLGLVISSLADKAMGKGKGTVVPYRDS